MPRADSDDVTRMKRSWPWTLGWIVTSLVSFAITYALVRSALEPDSSWLWWVGVVLVGGFGLIGGYLAIWSAGSVACVRCAKRITGFEPGNAAQQIGVCPECNVYVAVEKGIVRSVGDDEISERHPFRVAVDGNVAWPPRCLVCNERAVRETEATFDLSKTGSNVAASAAGLALFAVAGAGFVRYGGGTRITLRTPACAMHEGGAKIVGLTGGRAIIGFRSRRVHREFLDANRHATIEPDFRGIVENDEAPAETQKPAA
jgi:hypothetical protein